MKFTIFLIFIIYFCSKKLNCQSINKYEVVIDRFIMPKNNFIDSTNFRVRNYNRTVKVLNGTMIFLQPLTDEMSATITLFVESGNEFRRIGMKDIDKICSLFRDEKYYVPKYVTKYSTFTYPIVCPLPAV